MYKHMFSRQVTYQRPGMLGLSTKIKCNVFRVPLRSWQLAAVAIHGPVRHNISTPLDVQPIPRVDSSVCRYSTLQLCCSIFTFFLCLAFLCPYVISNASTSTSDVCVKCGHSVAGLKVRSVGCAIRKVHDGICL